MDREFYTRVTSVVGAFSGFHKIPKNVLESAQDRGIQVHAICDGIIKDLATEADADEVLKGYVKSFMYWLKDYQPDVLTPDRFYDDELRLTGMCDCLIAKDDGTYTLIDFKTSAREGKGWALQGSAYKHMALIAGYNVTKIQFVKLCKIGNVPLVYTYEDNWDTFKKCLDVYRYFENSEPEIDLEYL